MTWKPIKTAPRNETLILATMPSQGKFLKGVPAVVMLRQGVWCNYDGRKCHDSFQPTHWMKLPSPPVMKDEGR